MHSFGVSDERSKYRMERRIKVINRFGIYLLVFLITINVEIKKRGSPANHANHRKCKEKGIRC